MFISPKTIYPLAFFGLAFPILFIVNVLILIYYLSKLKRFLYIPLIAVIFSVFLLGRFIQFGSNTEYTGSNASISLMTYNVHVFGRWDNQSLVEGKSKNVFKTVETYNPNILCFQEFYNTSKSAKSNLQKAKNLGYKYSRRIKYSKNKGQAEIVTFSKYPIVESSELRADNQGTYFGIMSDIELPNGKFIRVFNVHLSSIKITDEKEIFSNIPDLTSDAEKEKIKSGSISLLKKLRYAFERRTEQVYLLDDLISSSPYPVIIAGDFNETASSYSYQTIKSDRKDAFTENGKGLGATYKLGIAPLRIDFILFDKSLESVKFNTINDKDSDHNPIYTELRFWSD